MEKLAIALTLVASIPKKSMFLAIHSVSAVAPVRVVGTKEILRLGNFKGLQAADVIDANGLH